MQYGFFANQEKEYVITRPDTPAPWINYLGSPAYGAIISQNAGGYSFIKSAAKGRILRYRFNQEDSPGRYIYLRDDQTADFWSASWQPVAKTEGYESRCRHGLGYTVIESDYNNISTETTYYVPLNQTYEVWHLKLKNNSDHEREISIFGYAELTNHGDYEQDMVNLQYSQFISRTYFNENQIIQAISENSDESVYRFFALTGATIESYTGVKNDFLGDYHSYRNPMAVIKGHCTNSLNLNLDSCGALHTKLRLAPSEEKNLTFLLGQQEPESASRIVKSYTTENGSIAHYLNDRIKLDLAEISSFWQEKLSNFQIETPDQMFNQMINTWNAYQCFITFTWSRAASLTYCGQRDGYGYRDTVQDIQGIIHLSPKLAREKLIFMLSAQVDHGGALPLVKFTHHAGHEDTPEDMSYVKETGHPAYRADDALWLFPTIQKYLGETGEQDFLNLVIPFANRDEATVYEHLKRALHFSYEHLGQNGLPAGLHADWNDTLRLGKKGESTFVSEQLYLALKIMADFAEIQGDLSYLSEIKQKQNDLYKKIISLCFEKDRFIRGITESGLRIGSNQSLEADFWLNPQSWAVISGLADHEKAEIILDKVYQTLSEPFGARLMSTPFKELDFDGAIAKIFNAGSKENASIFVQPQGWLILAEALLGHGNRAYEYYLASSPARQNEMAEIRTIEPYAYGQFTESSLSPHEGRSHVHWLTGAASTIMVSAVEGILGIRPDLNGLLLAPAIPSSWNHLTIKKIWRGKTILIEIQNDFGRESGFSEIYLNDKRHDNNYFAESELLEENKILYIF